MKLYHGTDDNELDITRTTGKIDGWNIFHGMFFADSLDVAESHGETVFESEINEDYILDAEQIPFINGVELIIRKLYKHSNLTDDEIIELIDLSSGKSSFESTIETERLAEILDVFDDGLGLEAYVDWECQNLSGYIAEKLGYKAVALYDEHGTTYLILPGNPIVKRTIES